jgi:hypothetical protein
MGLEWTTLKYIEDAPIVVRIATFVAALAILAIVEKRDWLKFKGKSLFHYAIVTAIAVYLSISGYAFYTTSGHPADPIVSNLQSQLASSRRERDMAILERDAARRE